MIEIPIQLRTNRFNRVRAKSKEAFEKEWQNKPYSYEEITQFFPEENYGVICGRELRVLDDDTPDNRLVKLFLDNFGETFRVRNHLYFKFDNRHSKKIVLFDKEGNHVGELQGDGSYVVGPGSTHPTGEIYEVKNNEPIMIIPYIEFLEVFKDYVKNSTSEQIQGEKLEEIDLKIIEEIKLKWKEGDRQNLALSLSGYLRKQKRFGFEHTLSIIKKICEETGDNAFSERATAVKETYMKDESKIKGISALIERGLNFDSAPPLDNFLIIERYSKGESKGEVKDKKVNIDAVAKYIENKFDVRTIFGIKEETLEVYEEGIWSTTGKGIIKSEIERLLGVYSKNNIVSEILEKIKRRTEVSREETENVPDYKRCVQDGVLDLEDIDDIKLLPHSKEYNFRTKFPMKYNPSADCPKIKKFISETFYEEDIPKVQEWFGMHLPRKYTFKKASVFHGPKDTGKTVVLNLLTRFVGENVSGLSLQEISQGKPFDLLALKDKDANICDDLSSADMKAVGGFKMAVGDGYITGEYKFGDKVRWRNTAKDTNACNKIPSPGEDIDDEAYYGRILLFPIENVVPKEKMNKNLLDELTTPEELSGLLNWAIEGYKRLVKQNGFTNDKTPEETKFLMVQNGNSLARFASEVLTQADGKKVDKEEMYQVYCKWCMNHKPQLSPDSKDKIGKTLTKFAPYTQASSNGKERYWLNVKINDSYYIFQNNMSILQKVDNDVKNNIYNFSGPVIAVSKKEPKFTPEEIALAGYNEEELPDIQENGGEETR